jgi:hypothetical protein
VILFCTLTKSAQKVFEPLTEDFINLPIAQGVCGHGYFIGQSPMKFRDPASLVFVATKT